MTRGGDAIAALLDATTLGIWAGGSSATELATVLSVAAARREC
ncbi:hypothetical protein [Actinoplanes sp. HUAS TT8]